MKNENTSLKRSLEELDKLRIQEKQKQRSAGETERKIPRGECEGKDLGKEEEADKRETRKEEMMRAQREDGEGEEVLLKERKEESKNDIDTKERGEAEGEKWTGKDKTQSMTPKEESKSYNKIPIQKGKQEEEMREMEVKMDKLHREIHALSTQLQQAVEEVNQQANLVQELQSKLGEQTKKSWEAEQKLALLEVESQRLRKAAESLTEARKQIEVS